jgi:uncharacterized protein DUF4238
VQQLKKNHHYVPQFWLRGFRGANGRLWRREGKNVVQVQITEIMQEDWLYTVFDAQWNASDELEDRLSIIEGSAARIFKAIQDPNYPVSAEEREQLCAFLGLQACRHPDILKLGIRRCSDFAEILACVHHGTLADFIELTKNAMTTNDAVLYYDLLKNKSEAELNAEYAEVLEASPQDPRLPMQDALRAYDPIGSVISNMKLTLLDVPLGSFFVLGDTPMPQFDLQKGFRIPLSKSVALDASTANPCRTGIARRQATAEEVKAVNRLQWENAAKVVVGPDRAVLQL